MTPTRRAFAPLASAALCAGVLLVALGACSTTTKPAGGLELVLSTDMLTPTDFDSMRLLVKQETTPGGSLTTLLSNDFLIPSEATLPTTFGIGAGKSPDQTAFIQLTALLDGTPIVVREVEIQVPTDRVAELALILSSRCAGAANVTVV